MSGRNGDQGDWLLCSKVHGAAYSDSDEYCLGSPESLPSQAQSRVEEKVEKDQAEAEVQLRNRGAEGAAECANS